jgi:N-methylhydantoinase B
MTVTKAECTDRASDPITLEIIRHAVLAIPNHIDVNITRTAYSPLIYEYKDYAVGIVDARGALIAQSEGGIPLFIANALGVAVRDGLHVHGENNIRHGDVLITNHAATMGQHLNNVVMYTPIYSGVQLFGFMAVLVHWTDVGGNVVGSFVSHSNTSIFQEGVQFRSIKLLREGVPDPAIYRTIEANTRFPRQVLGDMEAQLNGCLRGREMMSEVIDRYGLSAVLAMVTHLWDRSEAAARAVVRSIPDGNYVGISELDNDGITLDQRIPIEVRIRIAGEEMYIDLSGCADQVMGPINSGREGGAIAAARIAFKYLMASNEPANEGLFRPLTVSIPEGTFLSATGEAALGSYSLPLASVIDTILKALVPAIPEKLAAGHHANFGVHLFHGYDSKTGELYQHIETAHGGWGASKGFDGPGPYKTMAHGDTLDVPAEAIEALYPLRVEEAGLITDSGGAGMFRGGLGVKRTICALAPCELRVLNERTKCPPWGILGGQEAGSPSTVVARKDGSSETVLKGAVTLLPGDRVHMASSGGGGYGDPHRRGPDAVARDTALGNVSVAAARDLYGVEIAEPSLKDMKLVGEPAPPMFGGERATEKQTRRAEG